MKNKQYYINQFYKYIDWCYNKATTDIEAYNLTHVDIDEFVWKIFEDTATAEPIVGYYIVYHEHLALSTWLENISRIEMSNQDIEIDTTLKRLYCEKQSRMK